jgi:hypothetical protein
MNFFFFGKWKTKIPTVQGFFCHLIYIYNIVCLGQRIDKILFTQAQAMEAILLLPPVLDGRQSIIYASLYIRQLSSISVISFPKKKELKQKKKFKKFVQLQLTALLQ